jgi:hypothetical protein
MGKVFLVGAGLEDPGLLIITGETTRKRASLGTHHPGEVSR